MRQIAVSIERARLKNNAEMLGRGDCRTRSVSAPHSMTDISDLGALMKECEADRDLLRTRVNAAEEQILVLKASNEIMERWLAFFKDRNALDVRIAPASDRNHTGPIDFRKNGSQHDPAPSFRDWTPRG